MRTVKQLIERLDTEIEMVCCDSARSDWQTLKDKVLAQQTHNSKSMPCQDHFMHKSFTRYVCENCGEVEDRWE